MQARLHGVLQHKLWEATLLHSNRPWTLIISQVWVVPCWQRQLFHLQWEQGRGCFNISQNFPQNMICHDVQHLINSLRFTCDVYFLWLLSNLLVSCGWSSALKRSNWIKLQFDSSSPRNARPCVARYRKLDKIMTNILAGSFPSLCALLGSSPISDDVFGVVITASTTLRWHFYSACFLNAIVASFLLV